MGRVLTTAMIENLEDIWAAQRGLVDADQIRRIEVPDGVPILIGQLPFEHLDFVVDMRSHSLIGNPAHGGDTSSV